MEDIAKGAEKKINEGAGRVHEGIEKARRNTVDMIEKNTSADTDEIIRSVRERGQEYLNQAKQKGEDLLNAVSTGGRASMKNLANYIESRPAQAVAIAACVGLVAGLLLASSSKED